MHPCLRLDEIVRLIASELVASGERGTSVALACCCKNLEDPVLDVLWTTQRRLGPLLGSLPGNVWNDGGFIVSATTTPLFLSLNCSVWKAFKRPPTTLELARFRKYAQRMRSLTEHAHPSVVSPEVFSILQPPTINEPLFPNLKILHLWDASVECIPFIPSFLSPRTATIHIGFPSSDSHEAAVASVITAFPTLCPNLQGIAFYSLPNGPVVAAAVSGMVLATNRNTLRRFHVDCPLTQAAREVICELPHLGDLSITIGGDTSLPLIVLPSLFNLAVIYGDGSDWLQGFRGATLGKLKSIIIHSKSNSIGNFLEAFESVMLTTTVPATLSAFGFHTSRPWRPNYRSLLPFTQLGELTIAFSCDQGCSSTIDDDTIIDIARAMPNLELLYLGGVPCQTPTGVTAKGLAALAYYCLNLFALRIHFRVDSLDPPSASIITTSDQPITSRTDCALTTLEVGEMPMMVGSALMVALTLLHIFPHLEFIEYYNEGWEEVAGAIALSRKLADASSKKLSLTHSTK